MAELTINTAPAVSTWENRVSTALPGSRDEVTHALAPEQLAVGEDQQRLLDEQKRIEEQHALATQAENTVKAETSQQMAAAALQKEKDHEAAIVSSDKQIDEWRTRMRSANDAYQSAPLPSLFKSGETGRNVLKGIGLLLGAIGDARLTTATMLSGHAPSGRSSVDEMIQADFASQREAIEKLKDNAVMAAAGLKDAKEGRALLLANLETKQAAVYDRIAKISAARLDAIKDKGAPNQPGTDAATLGKDSRIAEWQDKALEKRAAAVAPLTESITKKFGGTAERTTRAPTQASGGGGVEADKNAANFNLLREHSEWLADNMAKLTPADVEAINRARSQDTLMQGNKYVGAAAGTLAIDTQAGMSSLGKEYLDRASRAEDAIGRLKSGGAINGDEDTRFSRWVTPVVSDKPQDRSMRAKNMRKDVETIGGFMDRAPRNTVSRPEGPAAPTPKVETDKDRAIRLLRANPALPGAATIKSKLGITDAELRGAP